MISEISPTFNNPIIRDACEHAETLLIEKMNAAQSILKDIENAEIFLRNFLQNSVYPQKEVSVILNSNEELIWAEYQDTTFSKKYKILLKSHHSKCSRTITYLTYKHVNRIPHIEVSISQLIKKVIIESEWTKDYWKDKLDEQM